MFFINIFLILKWKTALWSMNQDGYFSITILNSIHFKNIWFTYLNISNLFFRYFRQLSWSDHVITKHIFTSRLPFFLWLTKSKLDFFSQRLRISLNFDYIRYNSPSLILDSNGRTLNLRVWLTISVDNIIT